MRIGYRFCGNCNPRYETWVLLRELQQEDPENKYVYWEDGKYDRLLILSGCERDCSHRPSPTVPTVVVAGETVDLRHVAREDLCRVVLERLRAL